jgi:hypothetical protein
MTELPQSWREKIADRQWYPSGIPYQVQEEGFIFGEFHREEYAKIFANALIKDGKASSHLSIWGPDGWVEYENG